MVVTAKVVRKRHKQLPSSIKGPRRVKVGFPAGAADGGNISKAVWNEFGTRGGASGGGWGGPIPERPFMRNAVRGSQGKWRDALKTSAAKILRGDTNTHVVMLKLGIQAVGDIQKEITSLASPPNSPVTIALKGSSNPLIDTGEMRGATNFMVID